MPRIATSTATATTTVPTRRFYVCNRCRHPFHTSSSNTPTTTIPSPFRCSCYRSYDAISRSTPTLPIRIINVPSVSGTSLVSDVASYEDNSILEFRTAQRRKPLPASKSFIDSLPTIKIDPATPPQSCPICMDDFGVHSNAVELPCQHVFDKDCIVQWLNRSNTCPLCRYKFPRKPRLSPSHRPSPAVEQRRNRHEAFRRPGVNSGASLRRSNRSNNDEPPRDADGDTLMVDAGRR